MIRRLLRGGLLLVTLLAGCIAAPTPAPTPPPPSVTAIVEVPTDAPSQAFPWTDEAGVMRGLCFESVWDAAGQGFVIETADDLRAFYDLADNSGLCRRPVVRGEFDFNGGRMLIGTWTRGRGCDAAHEVISYQRDDVSRVFIIRLRLVEQGDCAYTLVQPFWIGVTGLQDFDVRLLLDDAG